MRQHLSALLVGVVVANLLLAGCTGVANIAKPSDITVSPSFLGQQSAHSSLAKLDLAEVMHRFGTPQLDISEGSFRELQYREKVDGTGCVLDVWLLSQGHGKALRVTYVEARDGAGRAFDVARCAAGVQRR